MSAHTPGPWRLHFWAENVGISADRPKQRDCETVATVYRGPETASYATDREKADANARLIAAAPDLLEALDGVIGFIDDLALLGGMTANGGAQERLDAARAAIAKARGEK